MTTVTVISFGCPLLLCLSYWILMVLGKPCFWQELQENWYKHFRTRKHKVITSMMSSLCASFCIYMLQSESSICGGLSQYHEYLLKSLLWYHHYLISGWNNFHSPSSIFMQLLLFQELIKYYYCLVATLWCGNKQ